MIASPCCRHFSIHRAAVVAMGRGSTSLSYCLRHHHVARRGCSHRPLGRGDSIAMSPRPITNYGSIMDANHHHRRRCKSFAAAIHHPQEHTDTTAATSNMMIHLLNAPAWFGDNNHTTSSNLAPDFQDQDTEAQAATAEASISTMKELIEQVPLVVRERKEHDIEPGSSDDPVLQLLRHSELSREEWGRYAFFDPSKPYTRNLVATDHQTYTLLLLCWNAGEESPIHDHPCDGCWLQVLEGHIQECRYSADDLTCTADVQVHKGDIAHMTDNLGYHKIGNPGTLPAVSLHIYAPPIQECRTWNLPSFHDEEGDTTNLAKTTSATTCPTTAKPEHYSEYGRLIDAADP